MRFSDEIKEVPESEILTQLGSQTLTFLFESLESLLQKKIDISLFIGERLNICVNKQSTLTRFRLVVRGITAFLQKRSQDYKTKHGCMFKGWMFVRSEMFYDKNVQLTLNPINCRGAEGGWSIGEWDLRGLDDYQSFG